MTNQHGASERHEGVRRREVIKGAAVAGLGIAGANLLPNVSQAAPAKKSISQSLIREENAKPGTRDWLLTKTRTSTLR